MKLKVPTKFLKIPNSHGYFEIKELLLFSIKKIGVGEWKPILRWAFKHFIVVVLYLVEPQRSVREQA